MNRVRVFRHTGGRSLIPSGKWIEGGTPVTVGDPRTLHFDHRNQTALPLEGEDGLYILDRDLNEEHEPTPAS